MARRSMEVSKRKASRPSRQGEAPKLQIPPPVRRERRARKVMLALKAEELEILERAAEARGEPVAVTARTFALAVARQQLGLSGDD